MVFDFYHGHGWHDPDGAARVQDGRLASPRAGLGPGPGHQVLPRRQAAGSTWGKQAWWERPTPHAIHLCYPGAAYDELCVYDRPLSDAEVAALVEGQPVGSPRPAAGHADEAAATG